MGALFGKEKTPRQILRDAQQLLRRGIRDVDRERTILQKEEKRAMDEVRRMLQRGQPETAAVLAKDAIRTKRAIGHFYKMRGEMTALKTRLQVMSSSAAMQEAMVGGARALYRLNRMLDVPAMYRIVATFEAQCDMSEIKQEVMSESLDGETLEPEDDSAIAELLAQAAEEVGAPSIVFPVVPVPATPTPALDSPASSVEEDLAARLKRLKDNQ